MIPLHSLLRIDGGQISTIWTMLMHLSKVLEKREPIVSVTSSSFSALMDMLRNWDKSGRLLTKQFFVVEMMVWSDISSLCCRTSTPLTSIPCDSIKSKVWFRQWVGPDMCCLTLIELRMSMNADPNASFSLPTWILKSPAIETLSAASTNADRKSPNSLINTYIYTHRSLY